MSRFVEGCDRRQIALLPDCLDDYVTEDNPVRVVDAFIDELDLAVLGFAGVVPEPTGRPAYHPSTLLKIYLYGYVNQVQSSRWLEREAQRNIELMWLIGKLAPDFKTIADFRRDKGEAIRAVCRQFVLLCRGVGLIGGATVAVDGSRFKAVNTRDKNYTPGAIRLWMEQVDASIARYLRMLDTADRQEDQVAELRVARLSERLEALRRQMRQLQVMEQAVADTPDDQVSLTDPDARAMATNGKGTGMVGYNVQTVVDAKHHLIIAHEVTNVGHDKHQLANMARQAMEVTGANGLTVLADRGYFSGEQVVACEAAGATPIEQQAKPFGVREIGALRIGLQLGEGARHAGEPELVHLVEGRMGQHDQASSMVVAGAADVGMIGQQLALPSSSGRLLVEPMLEDRLDRSVGTGADVEAAVASRFQPTGAVLAA